jgi:Pathogenicity locus
MQHDLTPPVQNLRAELAPLRGLWPGVEADLRSMGFSVLADLCGKDPGALALDYCRRLRRPADPLLTSCFAAIVRFAETGVPTPWFHILRAETVRTYEQVA